MKKLAIFVEGQTEQIFIHRLLVEIATRKNLKVELDKLIGGRKLERQIRESKVFDSEEEAKFYVLIRNSATDSKVASDIRDSFTKLKESGYQEIIGVQDLFPFELDKLQKLVSGLAKSIPQDQDMPAEVIVAVREIETWFLAEHSHFINIDACLTVENINEKLGLDFNTLNVVSIEYPADTLHQIYNIADYAYRKSKNHVHRTVEALDYEKIYLDIRRILNCLDRLILKLDNFLTL